MVAIRAVLTDIDGVLTVSWRPLPGAVEAIKAVRDVGTAEVTGKPAAAFFTAALDALGAPPAAAVMVGDDIDSDVLAAQRLGVTGVLVRTGKFQGATGRTSTLAPDHVIDSVAGLPELLTRLS